MSEERELSFWRRSRRLDRLVARYVVILAAVLGIAVLTFASLADLDARARAADAERYGTQWILHAQGDEQNGLRGFAATGKRSDLEPYWFARRELNDYLAFLRSRTQNNAELARDLDAFEVDHVNWERVVAAPLLDRPSDRINEDRERLGKGLMDGMTASIAAVDMYYAKELERIERDRQLVRIISYVLILAAVVIVATNGYYSERASAHREERLLRSVVSQRDTMARQSEWRTKIIAILAHDFRTSLAVIEANAELLEDHPGAALQANAFRSIHKGVSDLASMTDEALLMARVANDTLVIAPHAVFIYDLIAEVADRFSGRQDILVGLSDECVRGDEAYLKRVFDNLISNAVKYSNGPINVRITSHEKSVEIAVVDHGPGIDAADLPHVFEEYWRAESARGKRGTGIGLYIVKKIIDAHHGIVKVESAPGEGTTVRVILARARAPRPQLERADEEAYD